MIRLGYEPRLLMIIGGVQVKFQVFLPLNPHQSPILSSPNLTVETCSGLLSGHRWLWFCFHLCKVLICEAEEKGWVSRPVAPGEEPEEVPSGQTYPRMPRKRQRETQNSQGTPGREAGWNDNVLTFSFLWLLVFLREKSHLLRDFLHFRVEPLEA